MIYIKRISAQVSLKVPGNQSRNYSLAFQGAVDDKGIYLLESEEKNTINHYRENRT